MRSLPVLACTAIVAIASFAGAAEFTAGDMIVADPWARATAPAAQTGAAYMALDNRGPQADFLTAAASPVAETVELHTIVVEDGVMRMRPVSSIEIGPRAATELVPGGFHVMLIGLTGPLEEGTSFPLELTFEGVGTMHVEVEVRAPDAMP